MYGIHTGSGFKYNHNPHTTQGNILCGAQEFSDKLSKYKGDSFKALTAYKGISTLGRTQAGYVLNIARKIQ